MRALVCVAVLLQAGSAAAWCQLTTSQADPEGRACVEDGTPLRWMRPCISYSIDMSGSAYQDLETVRTLVGLSFDQWTNTLCSGTQIDLQVEETELAVCHRAEYSAGGSNSNTIAFRSDWPGRYDDLAYAITTVWHSKRTGEILDADILVNEEQFPWADCAMGGCDDAPDGLPYVDVRNVMTHEAGHFFGLAHSQLLAATMDPQSARGDTFKRILRTDDVLGICTIYPPGTMDGECDFAPRGGLDLDCTDDGCSAGGRSTGWTGAFLLLLLFSRRFWRAVWLGAVSPSSKSD